MNVRRVFHMRTLKTLFFAVSLAGAVLSTAYGQSKVGTSAAQFLGIGVGPRAIAMGGAYVASYEDVSAIYWNPGAFVQANGSQLSFSSSAWLVGSTFRWLGFMYNIDGQNAFGLSLTQLDYGEEEVTTVAAPEGTGDRWSAQDLAISLSYSRRFTDHFSLGGSVKYIDQSIWHESAKGVTFDLGLLFQTEFNNLRIGMSMSNFGGDLTLDGSDLLIPVSVDPANSGSNQSLSGKLKTDGWPTPLLFRVGVAIDVVRDDQLSVTLATDALRPSDNDESINLGGEVGWRNMLFFRAGYKSILLQNDVNNSQEGLSLGGGLRLTSEGLGSLEFDYAFSKFGLFDNINTIAISIRF